MVSVQYKFFFVLVALHCVSGDDPNLPYPFSIIPCSLFCRSNEFKCKNGEQCIPVSYRCDRIPDCDDRSDESMSECGPDHCPDDRHLCGDNIRWREIEVCNGEEDCIDGSDERNCGNVTTCGVNEFRCSDGSKCIPMRLRCSKGHDCSDGSDERDCGPCPEGMLRCDSGQCVRGMLFCNGREDCDDGSDEKDCGLEDGDIYFVNEGPDIYMKKRTKAGLEFTHLLPISVRMKRFGVHNGMKITGLAYDVRNHNLFISDAREPAIIATNLSSFDWRYLVNDNITFPADVGFDYTSSNVYWIDSGRGTVEAVSVGTLRRTIIVTDMSNLVSIALSPNTGIMFIATIGFGTRVFMYGMDGIYKRILYPVQGWPASLAVHPTKTLLYWTDHGEGTISYVNYSSDSSPKILRKNVDGVMSVTVTERKFFFTSGELTSERSRMGMNPGHEKEEGWKSITFGVRPHSGKSECLIENGGCDYLCLTSEVGRSCACPSEKRLGEDGKSCFD